ncbi:MAG: OprO/OprP family phosphate-selective porin [Melioribacteraceae bacterium]|nr:OprO/OprP family phosphate-selective porin [Melioribacteraceae bacterium]
MIRKIVIIIALFLSNISYAQFDDFFEPKTTIGGYGELHYNYVNPEGGDVSKTLDFHRFVTFISHSWNEKWSFKAEIELEHNFVNDGEGELELEQAFINYHHADWFGFQIGVVLPSVGLINEIHEPPTFFGVERPDYHKTIIPTTWFGNGLSIYGKYKSFDYKLTVMEGLNSDNFSTGGIRGGRQKGYKSDADELLYNVRVDYLGLTGLRAGASFTYNNAKSKLTQIPINIFEAHAKYVNNNLYLVGEYGMINYQDFSVEQSVGYYFDLGYDVSEIIGWSVESIPFVRFTNVNPSATTLLGGITEEEKSVQKIMFGINLKPLPEVVFKMDYSVAEVKSSSAKTTYFNIGAGYMF